VMEFSGQEFDTILMLMNGIGMVGNMDGLRDFLRHAHQLVSPGGQILCDSIDVGITTDPQHVRYRKRTIASGRPAGQQAFIMECEGVEPTVLNWLHIDFESLARMASASGWEAQLLVQEPQGHYLCKLSAKQNEKD